jgi:anti-sigma regulatory factor (Ser/Thr protein kinase)
MSITSDGNTISVQHEISKDACLRLLAAMHNTVAIRGYQDLTLDFSSCSGAFSPEMLALCARCLTYGQEGIHISIVLPTDPRMRRLFLNTNWAHLLDQRSYEPSRYRGYTHAAALRFSDAREQHKAADKILDILLAAISHFRRNDIRYIEWIVNELTDNVINHARSSIGGIAQVTNLRQREQIEISVCDGGLGIPHTLRQSDPMLRSDTEALDAAIKEGVTRDKKLGQGNGLYGTWSIAQKSRGRVLILPGYASLVSSMRDGLHIRSESIPLNGTLVAARIGYSDKIDLSEGLIFGGRRHVPVDYIETHFEEDEHGNVRFVLKNESDSFGSRAAGEPVRRKLLNVVRALNTGRVVVDFTDVMLVSSSYADEVFGKLFIEMGPLDFMQKLGMENLDPLVKALIDRAIMQRMLQ